MIQPPSISQRQARADCDSAVFWRERDCLIHVLRHPNREMNRRSLMRLASLHPSTAGEGGCDSAVSIFFVFGQTQAVDLLWVLWYEWSDMNEVFEPDHPLSCHHPDGSWDSRILNIMVSAIITSIHLRLTYNITFQSLFYSSLWLFRGWWDNSWERPSMVKELRTDELEKAAPQVGWRAKSSSLPWIVVSQFLTTIHPLFNSEEFFRSGFLRLFCDVYLKNLSPSQHHGCLLLTKCVNHMNPTVEWSTENCFYEWRTRKIKTRE